MGGSLSVCLFDFCFQTMANQSHGVKRILKKKKKEEMRTIQGLVWTPKPPFNFLHIT